MAVYMNASASSSASAADPAGLLPESVAGYRGDGKDQRVDRDGLFSLIDGGAEVYRALNVRAVVERRYRKPGAPDILVDIFDMGSSADAFGAYHHDMREGAGADLGAESERQGGNLYFWKDRYYVSVVPLGTQAGVGEGVTALAAAIATAIRGAGRPPDLVELLPREGLDHRQLHYFHDGSLLDRLLWLGEQDFWQLGPDTEGLLARYQTAEPDGGAAEAPALLILRYPDQARASQALRAAQAWKPPAGSPGQRLTLRLQGRLLAGMLGGDPGWARAQLAALPLQKGSK
jgi:hypothetical protein